MTQCRPIRWCPAVAALLLALLEGCAATRPSAIVDFSAASAAGTAATSRPADTPAPSFRSTPWREAPAIRARPVRSRHVPAAGSYKVQRGDTLHRVARHYEIDYKDLAAWNNLPPPYVLHVGQTLRLTPGQRHQERRAHETPRHLAAGPVRRPLPVAPRSLPESTAPGAAAEADAPPLARDKKKASAPQRGTTQAVVEKDGITWEWPAAGRIITGFKDSGNAKGVDIAGRLGEPVHAAASGTVVYSGSGLRGYGQLIIIKHSKTYLSAYAHNHRLLVKEGQHVKRGQEIAEMGSTDADQPKLHFEIRRLGKPVDPLHYLPTDRAL